MIRHGASTGLLLLAASACTGPSWNSHLTASPRQVALALDDFVELPSKEPFDPASIPSFKPPEQVRPCCAFGMDLRAKLGAMPVPFENGNIVASDALGRHGYGDALGPENNGLVYTCLRALCAGQPPPLPLSTPQAIDKTKMEDLLTVEVTFDDWIPSHFSVPLTKGKTFTQADFHHIIAGIRDDFTRELGPGYDSPRPRGATPGKGSPSKGASD